MNQIVKKWDRWINNDLLGCIQRPQPYNFCSLAVIQELLLYFGIEKTYQDLITENNVKVENITHGKYGNKKVIGILEKYGFQSEFYNQQNQIDWYDVKLQICGIISNSAFILHRKGHYSLIVGYLEEPLIKNNGDHVKFDSNIIQKWLILGEHRVKAGSSRQHGMLEMITWDQYLKICSMKPNYGIIRVFKP